MDSSTMNVGLKADGKQKYTSKYFPPNNFIYSGPRDDNAHNMGFLAGFAEAQVRLRVREGVLLIRLWSDAYDALDAEQQSEVYQQYLVLVRKIAGREELDPEKAKNTPLFLADVTTFTAKVNRKEGTLAQALAQAPAPQTATPSPSMTTRSMTTPSQRSPSLGMSLGNLDPHATKFSSPKAPAKKENEKPRQAEPKSAVVSNFEERCKKLGLRVSSDNV